MLDHNGYPVAAVALTFPAGEVDAATREALAAATGEAAASVAAHIRGRTTAPA